LEVLRPAANCKRRISGYGFPNPINNTLNKQHFNADLAIVMLTRTSGCLRDFAEHAMTCRFPRYYGGLMTGAAALRAVCAMPTVQCYQSHYLVTEG